MHCVSWAIVVRPLRMYGEVRGVLPYPPEERPPVIHLWWGVTDRLVMPYASWEWFGTSTGGGT